MDQSKVCLTTFIYGVKYQEYIPFLVYSCKKAYPEYDIVLFLYDKLESIIKKQLSILDTQNVYIREESFKDCPHMTPLKAKSLRWVLWDDTFRNYDYLYIVDIDMLYIREPKLIHEQHCEHMNTTGLPYDNLVRCFKRSPFNLISIGSRLKNAGLQNIIGYLFGTRNDFRLSGLHFIDVENYYKIYNDEQRKYYKRMIYKGKFIRDVYSCNNESFLYLIMKEIGLTPGRLAIQTNSINMLDFENCARPEFRPHHGIHMGIFRIELQEKHEILESKPYDYYVKQFTKNIMNDKVFITLLNMSSERMKIQFDRFFRYYKLNTSILNK